MLALLLLAPALANTKYDNYIRDKVHGDGWHWSGKLRGGDVVVEPSNGNGGLDIGGALIHDWTGEIFIPGVKLDRVVSFLQDYDEQANYFRPEVIQTHLLSRDGNTWNISYRLVQTKVVTVMLDVDQTVTWFPVSPTRVYTTGNATHIAEVRDATGRPGKDHGYLWRLNTYWWMEEKDGGVYVESRSVSLSRTPPFGLGWLFNPIVSSLPGESLARQLAATRKAVLSR